MEQLLNFLKHIFKEGNNIQKTFLLLFTLHVIFNPIIFFFQEIIGNHYLSSVTSENSFRFLIRGWSSGRNGYSDWGTRWGYFRTNRYRRRCQTASQYE